MFFNYRIYDAGDRHMTLSANTAISAESLTYRDYIESALSKAHGRGNEISCIEWKLGFTPSVRRRIGEKFKKTDEGYAIYI